MLSRRSYWMVVSSLLLLLLGVNGATAQEVQPAATQAALGTAFTYQGRLEDGGGPASGAYDFQFSLFDQAENGVLLGSTVSDDVALADGLFTVMLDFGANAFTGEARFLEIAVRTGDSSGSFTTLTPRQPLTPAPYALALPGVFPQNGNVGVGMTAPSARLDVVAADEQIGVLATSNGRAIVGRIGITSCPADDSGKYAVGGCTGPTAFAGVLGRSDSGRGVVGFSNSGRGVEGTSSSGIGVIGNSDARGVIGTIGGTSCAGSYGVGGCAESAIGVFGRSNARGVVGTQGSISCAGSYGVGGCSSSDVGVLGSSGGGTAILGRTNTGNIFVGQSPEGSNRARIDASGKGFFNGGTQVGGADFAESMPVHTGLSTLEAGDVLVIDPDHPNAVMRSQAANSHLVAGVYSTNPSVLSIGDHAIDDSLAGEVPMAITGIAPTKVTTENGPIQPGDLLVTSSTPGMAMKALPLVISGVEIYPSGVILGKALEPLAGERGVINVLVILQ